MTTSPTKEDVDKAVCIELKITILLESTHRSSTLSCPLFPKLQKSEIHHSGRKPSICTIQPQVADAVSSSCDYVCQFIPVQFVLSWLRGVPFGNGLASLRHPPQLTWPAGVRQALQTVFVPCDRRHDLRTCCSSLSKTLLAREIYAEKNIKTCWNFAWLEENVSVSWKEKPWKTQYVSATTLRRLI